MADDVTLNINLTIGGPKPLTQVGNDSKQALTLAVTNVAVRSAKGQQSRLLKSLERDFAPVVERELQAMARDVSRMAIGINGDSGNNSPRGILSIDGRISRPMLGNSGPMSVSSVTGQWASRSKPYMRWKMRKYRTRKWFRNTGRMQEQLSSSSTFKQAYGPMRLNFKLTPLAEGGAGVSSLGRYRGGQSTNIKIGTLEVSPLRRLRLGDLPGIGQQATFNPSLFSGFTGFLKKKLIGKPQSVGYRPIIEPFLTYYMNRRIPNAVYRRLEDSLT